MAPRIMVVNDSQDILEMFRDLLTYEGFEAIAYRAPELAVADLRETKPDLIILDWLFGHEELGMQLLKLVRQDPAMAATPVLVCSAANQKVEAVEDELRAQGVGVVYKPFMIDDMLSAIRAALPPDACSTPVAHAP